MGWFNHQPVRKGIVCIAFVGSGGATHLQASVAVPCSIEPLAIQLFLKRHDVAKKSRSRDVGSVHMIIARKCSFKKG